MTEEQTINTPPEPKKKKRNWVVAISSVVGVILSLSPFINRALNEIYYYERQKIYAEMSSLRARGEYEEALQLGEELLDVSQGRVEKSNSHMVLAFLYLDLANQEKAEFHANKAQEIDSNNENLARFFATVSTLKMEESIEEGKYEEAISAGERTLAYLSTDEEKAYIHYLLSLGYDGLGQAEKSLAEEKIAIDLSPSTVSLLYVDSIWEAKSLWSDGKYEEMVESAKRGLELAATAEEKGAAHYWLGVGYFRLGQNDLAEQEEVLAMELLPESAGPPVTMAAIYLNRGNPTQALKYADVAIEIDKSYAWAHNARGLALSDLGRKSEAIQAIEQAVTLDPDTSLFRLNLTRIKDY